MTQPDLFPGLPAGGGDAADGRRKRDARAADRDVRIAPVADPARRESHRLSLRTFLEFYLAPWFRDPFSADHLQMIADLQHAILHDDSYVLVAPRGIGKTTIVLGAALWAILYGHKRCIVILCATGEHSLDRLDSIRMVIETNPLLWQDFPGPCTCVRALEGNWNRANGQTVKGQRTFIKWGGGRAVIFPTLDGEPSSGCCIATKSMKRSVRGLVYTTPDGRQVRPDLALVDDPLDKEDAESERTVEKLIKKLRFDIMFLGESGASVTTVVLGSILAKNDVCSQLLDPAQHPGFRRRRFQLLTALPDDAIDDKGKVTGLWAEYRDIRDRSVREHNDARLALDYYIAHRAAMDAGAATVFFHCYDTRRNEISTVQHAMNIIIDQGLDVFQAECQGIPPEDDPGTILLEPHRVQTAVVPGLARGHVPRNAVELALGVDVQRRALYWVCLAAAPGRVLQVVDYGVQDVHSPEGKIEHGDTVRQRAIEIAVLTALRDLREKITDEPYRRGGDGDPLPLGLATVDSNWLTQTVRDFCAETAGQFLPIVGCGSMREQKRWYVPSGAQVAPEGNIYLRPEAGRVVGYVHADACKQIVHTGLMLPADAPGSIRLFEPRARKEHHTYAHHICAEAQVEKSSGRIVWDKVKGRASNHYLDATAYAVAALDLLSVRSPAIGIHGLGRPVADHAQPRAWQRKPKRRIHLAEITR